MLINIKWKNVFINTKRLKWKAFEQIKIISINGRYFKMLNYIIKDYKKLIDVNQQIVKMQQQNLIKLGVIINENAY
jgi:hypothetical protein